MRSTLARAASTAQHHKPTNVSLDTDLVAEAKQPGINMPRACEKGLAAEIAAERGRRWQEDNADAIASSNASADTKGLPLARYRPF